jgi:hypothetical protein
VPHQTQTDHGNLVSAGPQEKFFSIDEFGPCSVKRRGGVALVAADETRTMPQRQRSKGSLICTAALELSANQVTQFYSKRKNTAEMIKMLEVLVAKYRDQDRIYLSWDAASWNASKAFIKRVDSMRDASIQRLHRESSWRRSPAVRNS